MKRSPEDNVQLLLGAQTPASKLVRYTCCLVLVVYSAFAKTLHAQLFTPTGYAAGEATVATATAWGAAENPANSGKAQGLTVQAYGFSHIELRGLDRFGVDVGRPFGITYVTLSAQAFAPPGYRLTTLHGSVSRTLSKDFTLGLRLGVLLGDYDEYGSERAPLAQLGIRYEVASRLTAGAHYTYSARPFLPLAEHRLRVGVEYVSSARVRVSATVWQAVDARAAAGLGVWFSACDRLQLQLGVRSGGTGLSLGARIGLPRGVKLLITAVAHQNLPVGAAYGVSWQQVQVGEVVGE